MSVQISKNKLIKYYVYGFSVITIFYTLFSLIALFTDLFSSVRIRIDFIGYILMGMIMFGFGFCFGYKQFNHNMDAGLFFGQLFFVSSMQMAVCIFDNIVIILRVFAPEKLDLTLPMEIQFIIVYFLTIGEYRFFTLIYLTSGLISIFGIRKRSELVIGYLFTLFIYSSLVLGYLFGLPISFPFLKNYHITFYFFSNLMILVIFLFIYIIIRLRFEKSFEIKKSQ